MTSILHTLKKKKFDYVQDALYMAQKEWGLDRLEVQGQCGVYHDTLLLIEENLVDDDVAEEIYLAGVRYMKCVVAAYSSDPAHANKFVYPPFHQVTNLHRINAEVYELATSEALGFVAASLLQHNTVRLYQTSLFLQDAKSIHLQTEWHRDLTMIPLDTREGGSVTLWCPLLRTLSHTNNDSMLQFAPGSHRDVSREHWFGPNSPEAFTFAQAHTLEVGDCTAHHGWTKHWAPGQPTDTPRLAIGFTYVIGDATVLSDWKAVTNNRYAPFKNEDEISFRDWIGDLKEGEVIDHSLLPIVYDGHPVVTPHKNTFVKRVLDTAELATARYMPESGPR